MTVIGIVGLIVGLAGAILAFVRWKPERELALSTALERRIEGLEKRLDGTEARLDKAEEELTIERGLSHAALSYIYRLVRAWPRDVVGIPQPGALLRERLDPDILAELPFEEETTPDR